MVLLLLCLFPGWCQFGNRFPLDLMPLAMLLIAMSMEGRLTWTSALLIALSIAVNAWGTYRFWVEQH
jgi:hypothetical protein